MQNGISTRNRLLTRPGQPANFSSPPPPPDFAKRNCFCNLKGGIKSDGGMGVGKSECLLKHPGSLDWFPSTWFPTVMRPCSKFSIILRYRLHVTNRKMEGFVGGWFIMRFHNGHTLFNRLAFHIISRPHCLESAEMKKTPMHRLHLTFTHGAKFSSINYPLGILLVSQH